MAPSSRPLLTFARVTSARARPWPPPLQVGLSSPSPTVLEILVALLGGAIAVAAFDTAVRLKENRLPPADAARYQYFLAHPLGEVRAEPHLAGFPLDRCSARSCRHSLVRARHAAHHQGVTPCSCLTLPPHPPATPQDDEDGIFSSRGGAASSSASEDAESCPTPTWISDDEIAAMHAANARDMEVANGRCGR